MRDPTAIGDELYTHAHGAGESSTISPAHAPMTVEASREGNREGNREATI